MCRKIQIKTKKTFGQKWPFRCGGTTIGIINMCLYFAAAPHDMHETLVPVNSCSILKKLPGRRPRRRIRRLRRRRRLPLSRGRLESHDRITFKITQHWKTTWRHLAEFKERLDAPLGRCFVICESGSGRCKAPTFVRCSLCLWSSGKGSLQTVGTVDVQEGQVGWRLRR